MIVVSNTSPIIVLYFAQHLDVLKRLFGKVYIPPAVHYELTSKARDKNLCSTIKNCSFIQKKNLETPIPELQHKLDWGEIEALTLSKQLNADLLILDDKRAQKEADLLSIPYVSSFALLMKAFQKGIISNLDQTYAILEAEQIFISKDLKNFLIILQDS